MINLFETFTDESAMLYQTLIKAGMNHTTVVIEDDGFLPDEIMTPYLFFSKFKPLKKDKGLYFNEVKTPPFWEIEGTNSEGTIKDMGKLKGRIYYCRNNRNRIVNRVEWLDEAGNRRSVDYYNKYGLKFATQVFNMSGQPIFKTYFDRNGKVIIYENHFTQAIVLTYKGKEHYFENKVAFIQFYLRESFEKLDGFIINSLSTPFFVVYHLDEKGKDYLFWQEHIADDLPGNMKIMFEAQSRDFSVVVPDRNEYERIVEVADHSVKRKILSSGYLYQYMKKAQNGHQVLTLTNSDQLEDIEQYINELPDYQFNIAAITEMSPKLMELGKYKNVKLYPSVKRETILTLYQTSHIYLDINHGNEILNAVRSAFDFNLLIYGHQKVAHNVKFTSSSHLFNQTDEIIAQFKKLIDRPKTYDEELKRQKEEANEITSAQFRKIFK